MNQNFRNQTFYSGLSFGLFMSFPPPSRLIHKKDKKRRERKDKNTGGGSEISEISAIFLNTSGLEGWSQLFVICRSPFGQRGGKELGE